VAQSERLPVHRGEPDRARPRLGQRAAQHRQRDVDAHDRATGADRIRRHRRRLTGPCRHIEHPLAGRDVRRAQQRGNVQPRPAPHEIVVGRGDVVEGQPAHNGGE